MKSGSNSNASKSKNRNSKLLGKVVAYFLLWVISIFIFFWVTWNLPLRILQPIMFGFLLLVVFYFDDSGIRLSLVKKLPEDFPGKKFLSKRRKIGDRMTQYYKTFTMLSLLLYWILPETRVFFLVPTKRLCSGSGGLSIYPAMIESAYGKRYKKATCL
ncbi:MAG: hypothetical protein R2912_04355 [Eubacteriales bacterium]